MSEKADIDMEAVEPKPKKQGSKTGKRFDIKKWNAVAMWSWAICTGTLHP